MNDEQRKQNFMQMSQYSMGMGPLGSRSGRPPSEQWWTINGEVLMEALRSVSSGGDPDLIYAELFANSTRDDGWLDPEADK